MNSLEAGQHVLLMGGVLVINIETGTQNGISPECGQNLAQIGFSPAHHFQHGHIAVNNFAVEISDHDIV